MKHLDTAQAPWIPTSEHVRLEARLTRWEDELPPSLLLTQQSIYMNKGSAQVGGLLFLHLTYRKTRCDLYRIGMQDSSNIWKAEGYEALVNRESFEKNLQDLCFQQAIFISSIFEEALRHGANTLADTWLSVVAHDACRIIVHYFSRNLGTLNRGNNTRQQAAACLQTNLQALKTMMPLNSLAKPLVGNKMIPP